MKNVSAKLTVALLALFLPILAHSQEAVSPVYKDGDWWKIKYKVTQGSVPRSCQFRYSEYVVKIVKGKARVYGVEGTSQQRLRCSRIANDLMGTAYEYDQHAKSLRFPLYVGKNWKKYICSDRGPRTRCTYQKVKVLSLEKVQLAGGEVEAYKLKRSHTIRARDGRDLTRYNIYHYSPKAKAIVLKTTKNLRRVYVFTVVDFGVGN